MLHSQKKELTPEENDVLDKFFSGQRKNSEKMPSREDVENFYLSSEGQEFSIKDDYKYNTIHITPRMRVHLRVLVPLIMFTSMLSPLLGLLLRGVEVWSLITPPITLATLLFGFELLWRNKKARPEPVEESLRLQRIRRDHPKHHSLMARILTRVFLGLYIVHLIAILGMAGYGYGILLLSLYAGILWIHNKNSKNK